ncbi:MAG: hypothetical protein ACXADO_05605 [Candidatus Thorarchaeota archaeon]|jgi:hypothetical protein
MANGFEMQEDGTFVEVNLSKDKLETHSVYCIVDDTTKSIFLWKGRLSGVRKKFIGAHAANRMRNEQGTTFRVHSVDEGDETSGFFTALDRCNDTTA